MADEPSSHKSPARGEAAEDASMKETPVGTDLPQAGDAQAPIRPATCSLAGNYVGHRLIASAARFVRRSDARIVERYAVTA